jgi:acyl carrier protein
VVPLFGQVGYCSANAFLDAFANQKSGDADIFVQSVNWDRWQSLGIALIAEDSHKKMTGEQLKGGMTREEGLKVFDYTMMEALPQVVVSTRDINRLAREIKELKVSTIKTAVKEEENQDVLYQRPNLSVEYVPPRNQTENLLVKEWKKFLGIDQIGIDDNFFDLGATSLDLIQMNLKLKEVLARDIPLVMMFTYPTIGSLSGYLSGGNGGERSVGVVEERGQQIKKGRRSMQNTYRLRRREATNENTI